jgi:membrane associated rhomboid family serine protease
VRDPRFDDRAPWEAVPEPPPRRTWTREPPGWGGSASPVTTRIIVINVVVFVLQLGTGDTLLVRYALWPLGRFVVPELMAAVGFRPWQLVTYAFLHASVAHIFLNMLGLRIFGREVEAALGSRRFFVLYVAAILSAGVAQLVVTSATGGTPYPTIGASGGVFGVLLAFGVLFPRRIVTLLIPPIPMPAWLFVLLYGLLELGSGVVQTGAGIAHFAHVGGMVGAYLVLRHWRRRALAAR